MANPLFDRVLPEDLADREQVLDIKAKVGDFERLVEIVGSDLAALPADERPREWRAGPVEIRLGFAWVDARREIPAVTGRVSALVAAVCQRCLEAIELPLESEFRMLLVRPDADDFADLAEFESWELEEETLRPVDIVEESLVMAMPLAPMHGSEDSCGALAKGIRDESPDMVRPFADLRSQMDKLDSNDDQ